MNKKWIILHRLQCQKLPEDINEKFNADLAWHDARYTHIESQDRPSYSVPNLSLASNHESKEYTGFASSAKVSWMRCIGIVEPETGFETSESAKRDPVHQRAQSLVMGHEGVKKNGGGSEMRRKYDRLEHLYFSRTDSRISHRTGVLYAEGEDFPSTMAMLLGASVDKVDGGNNVRLEKIRTLRRALEIQGKTRPVNSPTGVAHQYRKKTLNEYRKPDKGQFKAET